MISTLEFKERRYRGGILADSGLLIACVKNELDFQPNSPLVHVLAPDSYRWRCGYVFVDNGSPLYGVYYDDPRLAEVEVHGGLTFSDTMNIEGLQDCGWAFGFDCNHHMDMFDAWPTRRVRMECRRLADQLSEIISRISSGFVPSTSQPDHHGHGVMHSRGAYPSTPEPPGIVVPDDEEV